MGGKRYILCLLLTGIVCGAGNWSANGQCLSTQAVQARIDSAKRQPTGVSTALLVDIRQQLVQHNCPHDSIFARITMYLGYARYRDGQVETAIDLLNQSVNLFQRLPITLTKDLVTAYYYQGEALLAHHDVRQAAVAYRNCIRLGGSNPAYDKQVGYALSSMALMAYADGDYETGRLEADQAISIARRCHDTQLEARCLNESARNLLILGQYAKAMSYIDRAVALVKVSPALLSEQKVYDLLRAEALLGLKQYKSALKLFNELLAYYSRTKETGHIGDVYSYLGNCYRDDLHQPDQAMAYYRRAYAAFTDPYEKSRILKDISQIQRENEQYRAALSTLQQALQTIPIQFRQRDLRTNPLPESIRISAYKEYLLSLIWDKADTWVDYAKTMADPKPYLTHALAAYQTADQMVDQMRWAQSGQQSKLYWRQQTRLLYEHAIETCYRLGNTEQALHFFEKSRAVLLTDKINELGAGQILSPKLQAQEQELRQNVDRRLAELVSLRPGSEAYTKSQTALLQEQERSDEFVRKLEQSNLAYYRYRYDNRVTPLTDLQQYLDQQRAAFVSYFVGDSALYSLSVQSDKVRLIRQPLGSYRKNIRAYLTLLSQPNRLNRSFAEFLSLSHTLYRQLLAPLELPSGRLIVSPDGPFIPFETLSRSPAGLTYALDSFAFSYAYSARLLMRQSNLSTGSGADGDFLGVAPGRFAASLKQSPLPGSEAALQTISARFASSRLLFNQEATRQAFQEAASSYQIVHLFTHATATGEPRLYLADSTLSLSELGRDGVSHAQLVTLAACETGTGVDQEGEGVFSLARGFAAAGVPSVLTTLWSVQNESTYQITGQFYQYLADGLPKDIALQQARRDWIRNAEGADLLPSVWAGLILVGDTRPLETGNQHEWLGGVSGLLVGGLLQLAWRRWRRSRYDRAALAY